MTYLGNAFSLQMLDLTSPASVKIEPVSAEYVSGLEFTSAVGHADTANVLSGILGKKVACNRVSISLTEADTLVVAQLTGGRLPEGATTLPEGFNLQFVKVTLQ